MEKKKEKVYIYTRVSTLMQIDGYSLDAQKNRMKAFADFNQFEIVGEYEDAGKSGKSIEGRPAFSKMLEDIRSGKDGISYVLVFKLSRFGRNAADVLSTLQEMQDFGVNLICVEDGIDSSKDSGKLMISVLSAVAEIERENIRVQTMEGRLQKAREGRWNGGIAPYGYQLRDGKLFIDEEEAEAVRVIFDQYVNTGIGANGLAKYLEQHGIHKSTRNHSTNRMFHVKVIREILKNPVYCGKIAYGRSKTEKVKGTRNTYRRIKNDQYLLADGIHEPIISEELWQAAQVKLISQAKRYEHIEHGKDKIHLLTGIVKCPICGAGMYGNKCIKYKKSGEKYKDYYYYGCKHRNMQLGHKCTYRKQIEEDVLDMAVVEVISRITQKPEFNEKMRAKINIEVDTGAIDQVIGEMETQLRKAYLTKSNILNEIDSLDPEDRYYNQKKRDLDDRLYKMYDKIEACEENLIESKAKRDLLLADKITADNIMNVLMHFDLLFSAMNDLERRQLIEALVEAVDVFEERQPNGQWLKSIYFKLPIIDQDELSVGLEKDSTVETVVQLSKGDIDRDSSERKSIAKTDDIGMISGYNKGNKASETTNVKIDFSLENLDLSELRGKATYEQIKDYVREQTGFRVSTLYISQVKRKCGLEVGESYNKPKSEDAKQPQCTPEKEAAIMQALRHYGMI